MELVHGLDVVLEGKEIVLKGKLEHQLGSLEIAAKLPLIAALRILAAKSDNKIDDQLVDLVEKALE